MIRVTTVTLISLVGETAMAGAVGAGGISNVAIAYGFILFENLFKLRQLCLAVLKYSLRLAS